ncbi:MAG: hypothetical protein QOE93_2476 [Actinomycetota bacterium]|nr:hypothetical protein [Actinomycetota bacterium]
MRILDVGVEPVGVIAIGANATGVIAIGAMATGVVAVGQLARGGLVLGQLAIGLVSIGQLAVGVAWASGQVGIAATSGPGIVLGLFGRLYARNLLGRRPDPRWWLRAQTPAAVVVAVLVTVALAALWWFSTGTWLLHDLTRTGGILIDAPRPLR